MKIKCPHCGKESHIVYLLKKDNEDGCDYEGFYEICEHCKGEISLGDEWTAKNILNRMFITDVAKMYDFLEISKEDFLSSYSYLEEEDYEATKLYLDWLFINCKAQDNNKEWRFGNWVDD